MSEQDSGQQHSDRRDEAEEMARLQEQINNLPVGEHILYMMHSLSALAVNRLGLSPEDAARRDVEQARLAIDAFRALLGVLEEARPTEEIAAHRGVLSQLQMAFVGALGDAEAPAENEAPTEAAEAASGGEAPEAAEDASSGENAEVEEAEPGDAAPEDEPQKEPVKKTPAKKPAKPRSSAGDAAKKSGGTGKKKGS